MIKRNLTTLLVVSATIISLVTGLSTATAAVPTKANKSLKIGAHLQTRFAYSDELTPPTPSFQARRVRLNGKWQTGALKLTLKVAFEEGQSRLMNAYGTLALNKRVSVRVGQFKRTTNLDYLISSYGQRIYERSTIGNKIDSQRDIGVAMRGRWLGKMLDTSIAVFNGNGGGTAGNSDTDLRYEARVEGHLGRRVRYEKRRIGNKPRAMIGAGFGQLDMDDTTKNAAGTELWKRARRMTISGSVVLQGWRHELRGEWLQRTQDALDPAVGAEAPDATLTHVVRDGGYLQWAWALPLKVALETSARAQVYRRTGPGNHVVQFDAGGTWWLKKRSTKLSLHGWTRQAETAGVVGKRAWGILTQLQIRI